MTLRLICTDFDGVICNSLSECMAVAYAAYFDQPAGLKEMPRDFVACFIRFRYLVRDPGEYFVLVHSWERGIDAIARAFPAAVASSQPQLADFKRRFFDTRERLRQRDPARWLALHPPYCRYVDFLKGIALPVFIVTTKDAKSVEMLLEHYGLSVPPERIFAQQELAAKGGKRGAIREICDRQGVRPHEAVFVDDHLQHLRDVGDIGVPLFHADWGYADPESADYPIGVAPLSLDRLEDLSRARS